VAAAASYIFQGVLNNPAGTAYGHGIGRPAAGKTGTGNSGFFAAFAGYTPTLAGYVSVFNPVGQTSTADEMVGAGSCYRYYPGGTQDCPGQMYGANAPLSTWQDTFMHAQLGPALNFAYPPAQFFSEGQGLTETQVQRKKPKPGPGHHPGPVPTPPPLHGHH
jgi:membrane peptidoglycan carboxypeptidase